jgi:hypothetical protein
MTQTYRIALSSQDYTPPPAVYTHICLTQTGAAVVETRHYDEAAAERERAWQETQGNRAEVQSCQR